jgi:uncharacterized protein
MNLDIDKLLALAKLQFKLADDSVHGIDHWLEVLKNGLNIIKTNNADETVVTLFAIFHDCCRNTEKNDYEHGLRAWNYIESLNFDLTDEQKQLLKEAIINHNLNIISSDPTIGACWDADRLDLPRVGEILHPDYFSTFEARNMVAYKKQSIERSKYEYTKSRK